MSFNEDYPANYHFGHMIFERLYWLLDECEIGAPEHSTTSKVISDSTSLAKALRSFGLTPGDVVAIGGPDHHDIYLPLYAALFNGLPVLGVDHHIKYDDVRALFKLTKPKVAFCESSSYDTYAKAVKDLRHELDIKLLTYNNEHENMDNTMSNFIEIYFDKSEPEDFKVAEYDLEKIYPFLICTSGSMGKLKVAAFKNKSLLKKHAWVKKRQDKEPRQLNCLLRMMCISRRSIDETLLFLAPFTWLSFFFTPVSVGGTRYVRNQTSNTYNLDRVKDVIDRYKSSKGLFNTKLIDCMIARKDEVDLTCFESITITGSKVYKDVLTEFKELLPNDCILLEEYSQTELIGPVLAPNPFGPVGSCGKPMDLYCVKLVDPDTGVEIKKANVTGEMLVKGPVFSCYYNDPEETAKSFTEDGFYKTGDLLFRDEDDNYFYVDRVATLIKYRNSHVYPTELEEVIIKHPGVKDVCVVGIDDPVGQKPVACVVRHKSNVTAQEIKDFVASKLSEKHELRGGVLFLDSLPYTFTGKILRGKLKEIAMNSKRE